ncbi:hypothetical protein [Fulvivirga lutimaris]|uniref:hypothetical protein n=1 Tax=Fulvivirga lutimaris TaxID=1819566 RepID=UPI0012BBC1BE|nr:hypothetical protein [Fulvivirga lutimaris]MTI41799.1 hypothetical protein [Fulvivirga lutimaris]
MIRKAPHGRLSMFYKSIISILDHMSGKRSSFIKKYGYLLILLIIAILLSWGFYDQKTHTLSLEGHSKYVIGTVIGKQHRKSRGDWAKYQYLINGEKHTGSQKINVNVEIEIGDKFKVKYDSLDPDNSEMIFLEPMK